MKQKDPVVVHSYAQKGVYNVVQRGSCPGHRLIFKLNQTMKKKIRKYLEKLILLLSDCDGMCGRYDICKYCKSNQNEIRL